MSEKNRKKAEPKRKRVPRDYFKIDDTPENVARIIMTTPPKKPGEWDYQKRS